MLDESGDLFVVDNASYRLYEVLVIASEFASPTGIAVDQNRNLYLGTSAAGEVQEALAPGYTAVNTLAPGFAGAINGVALDGSGNVYMGDFTNTAVYELVAPSTKTLVSGSNPTGITVELSGSVYYADDLKRAVYEIPALGGSIPKSPTVKTLGSGFSSPLDVKLR